MRACHLNYQQIILYYYYSLNTDSSFASITDLDAFLKEFLDPS